MRDKEYQFIAEKLSSIAKKVFTVTPENPRALDSKEYKEAFKVDAESFDSIEDGVKAAIKSAKLSSTPILVSGSLYMYADIKSAVNNCK